MFIRRCALPAALLGVALVLTGCGSSSKKAASTATTAASTSTSATTASASIGTATDAKLGQILVDGTGRTLYHFTKDTGSTIACVDTCATTWPPLLAPAQGLPTTGPAGGAVGTVARPDGAMQVTYNGQTLYLYSGDTKAGDTNGQGIGGVWFVVPPKAAAAVSTPAAPGGSTATTAKATATTARPTTNATTAPTSPPATRPPTTSPPATSPPTTMGHTATTYCYYPPC